MHSRFKPLNLGECFKDVLMRFLGKFVNRNSKNIGKRFEMLYIFIYLKYCIHRASYCRGLHLTLHVYWIEPSELI